MAITPEQARAELARRELARRQTTTEQQSQPIQSQPERMVGGIGGFGAIPESAYKQGERNVLGNIVDRPAAAIRSTLQGKGYMAGAVNPSAVPKFQDVAIEAAQQSTSPYVNAAIGMPASAVGLALDIATSPADLLTVLLGSIGAKTAGTQIAGGINKAGSTIASGLKKAIKYEDDLQQAVKTSKSLEYLRDSFGKSVELAIEDVAQVPTQLGQWATKSKKAFEAIHDPIYEVQFQPSVVDPNIKVPVQTVANLNKMKKAIGELLTPKNWQEAPKTEMQQIKQFYGQINQAMKDAAKGAQKPIDEALDAYDEFMGNYHEVKKTIEDSMGNARSNKIKQVFQIGSEQAYKDAWKNVSQHSPEIKSVMDSMKKRTMLRNILKAGVTGGAGVGIVKAAQSM